MARPLWFAGMCDSLLLKIRAWNEGYNSGKVHSTRDFLNDRLQIVPAVTKMAHTISFTQQEMSYLKDIVTHYSFDKMLIREVTELSNKWRTMPMSNNGMRKYVLIFFPEHVTELYNMLVKAKTEHTMGMSMQEKIEEAQKSGKDLFEV